MIIQDRLDHNDTASITTHILLTQLYDDSKQALTELVDLLRCRLFRYCCAITGDPGLSEQIMVDIFKKLWQKRHEYDAADDSASYICSICRSSIFSTTQRKKHEMPTFNISTGQYLFSTSYNLEEAVISKMACQSLVRSAFGMLDPYQRELLHLKFYEQLSYTEIAKCCNIPLDTVKSKLHYAITKLREAVHNVPGYQIILGEKDDGDPC